MIFIPFFKKIDWSNPPLITLLLIVVNCLIFFTVQGDDDILAEQAFTFYLESELPGIEFPLYAAYLNDHQQWKKAGAYEEYLERQSNAEQLENKTQPVQDAEVAEKVKQLQLMMLVAPMKMDSGFYSALKSGDMFEDREKFKRWQALNRDFESRYNKMTTFGYGLKPDAPTLTTMFTNMFLHGGFGHLLGNMIFLFIIGFVVETALGKSAFSIGYILAGLFGGVLYIVLNHQSHIPTIGASGAIAGLMGMYTVLFGMRKINFFYYVFFYFDYVKGPALILLPIWLGHEVFQLLMSSADGVNYYAHIGGLSSGALFALVAKQYFGSVDIEYLDQDEKDQQRKDQLETALEYVAKLQVEKALPILRTLVDTHPDNRDYLNHWYKAAKLMPASDDFHLAAKRIMMLKDKNPQTYQRIHDVYLEYMKLAQPKPKMDVKLCLHLILSFALGRFFDDAEKLLAMVKNHKMREPVAEVILVLANAYQKANELNKCRSYLNLLTANFANTHASTEASARLQALRGKAG